MPVSHIGLTVAHLPTSCSFFLAALQPLGYRFIGHQGGQIGFGTNGSADFFLCQETLGAKAGVSHIAFSAPSPAAVRDFYAAALTAGGRLGRSPASRDEADGSFNAAVLDFDGNGIEDVYRDGGGRSADADGSDVFDHARVLGGRQSVADGEDSEEGSAVSGGVVRTKTRTASMLYRSATRSVTPSRVPSIGRSVSAPSVPVPVFEAIGDAPSEALIETLLGTAAGAAVAYAIYKVEDESVRAEAAYYASVKLRTHSSPSRTSRTGRDVTPQTGQRPRRGSNERGSHRGDETAAPRAYSAAVSARSAHSHRPLAIEAPPVPRSTTEHRYYSRTLISQGPSRLAQRQIEYVPAPASVAGRSRASTHRSTSSPKVLAPLAEGACVDARSVRGRASVSVVWTFVPEEQNRAMAPYTEQDRRSSAASVVSRRSQRHGDSKPAQSDHARAVPGYSNSSSTRSSDTVVSLSRHGRGSCPARRPSHVSAADVPTPPPRAPSSVSAAGVPAPPSPVGSGSALVRITSAAADRVAGIDRGEREDGVETDTLAPSDSISRTGSRSSRKGRTGKASSVPGIWQDMHDEPLKDMDPHCLTSSSRIALNPTVPPAARDEPISHGPLILSQDTDGSAAAAEPGRAGARRSTPRAAQHE
ncbi:hypothetical protein B0A49_03557 [Cryomyces minteri]|uniref:VOC domain-containing protein n=1 Tax=Cryomyces minteri TaxID=331657 RepID=A0A4U0XRW6_9PEZI|nr:hypothetical protein B0A49_03557 [Cryomyces minteri]